MLGLTPNRVAAIGSVAADLSAVALVVTNNLPHNYQATGVLAAALLAKAGVVVKYLDGAQNIDTLEHDAALYLNHSQQPAVTSEVPS